MDRTPAPLPLPRQNCRVEHRSVNAHSAIVPPVGGQYLGDATKADAYAAGHGRFQGEMTRYIPAAGQHGQGVQHWLGAAADEVSRSFVLFYQLRDEAVEAEAAVVGGQMNFGAGAAEILDAGGQ